MAPAVLRYVLFALLLPVSVFGAYFLVEATSTWRIAAAGLVGVWAVLTLQDNLRLAQEYRVAPPASEKRVLADYLVAHRIKYGRAGYWDCYIVDFLSRERVILASTDKVRVSAYQARVELNRANAVTVRRMPCDEGARVASWCITDPFIR